MTQKKYPEFGIMLVDDEQVVLDNYLFACGAAGITNTTQVIDSREVVSELQKKEYGIVVLDLMMPYISGTALLPQIHSQNPKTQVIVITAMDDVPTAVSCIKNGAVEYLLKPVESSRLISLIRRAIELREQSDEIRYLKKTIFNPDKHNSTSFQSIITRNAEMHAVFRYIRGIAKTRYPILIIGETGTGKELIARAIHDASGRDGPFIAVNIAAMNSQMVDDALFGHTKASFTGAEHERMGLIASAANGTLFLDEIGEIGSETQVKLLRFLQERQYYPVGSDSARFEDVRIVTATNRDIAFLRDSSRFRQDLFYRLHTHSLELPPLRRRMDDIPLLVRHFICITAHECGKREPVVPDDTMKTFCGYSYPGNIRELQAIVFDAVTTCESDILQAESIKKRLMAAHAVRQNSTIACDQNVSDNEKNSIIQFGSVLPLLRDAEPMLIEEALTRSNGNQTRAASILGISRKALNARIIRKKEEYR